MPSAALGLANRDCVKCALGPTPAHKQFYTVTHWRKAWRRAVVGGALYKNNIDQSVRNGKGHVKNSKGIRFHHHTKPAAAISFF